MAKRGGSREFTDLLSQVTVPVGGNITLAATLDKN